MDTSKLLEIIVRKYQQSVGKEKEKKKYKSRKLIKTVKRRKAIKGRRKIESEDYAEKSAKQTQAIQGTYAISNEVIAMGADEKELIEIVKKAIDEWTIEENLEVIINEDYK